MAKEYAAELEQAPASSGKPDRPIRPLTTISKTLAVLGLGVVAIGLALAAFISNSSFREDSDDVPSPEGVSSSGQDAPPAAGGYAIVTPRTYAVDEARLSDQEVILGIGAGNKYRAYVIKAMDGAPTVHVVDDLLDGQPISITHCDRTGCTKVFSGGKKGTVLPLSFGGFANHQLLIHAYGVNYYQGSLHPVGRNQAVFPYQEYEFEETTWKKWREAHPETDVYVGDLSSLHNGF